jgi:hypothetical protein
MCCYSIRNDIVTAIDDSYSLEQLKSPRFNLAIVRPLVDRLYALHDISVGEQFSYSFVFP